MPTHAVAVVGLAGRFPGARDLEDFWRQVAEGTEVLRELTDTELDNAGVSAKQRSQPGYVRRGTFLERSEDFDAGFFGFSPREAQVLDPQHRVFLECAWEALEHAGYAVGALPESVGVFAGSSIGTYLHAQILRNPALASAVGGYQLMLANDKDFLCTRVSYKLGLKGPSMAVQTACSTSLVAVQVACRSLQRGECDMALAGGVSILFPERAGYEFQEGMILSPDGRCRPFDEQARGTRAGAGAGIVVLKRLDQALADGDTVHAVIRGIAINNDGADKAGFTAPSVGGQVEVIATAQALAGVDARSVTYLEAHGTATPLGDPIEVAALTQAFRADTDDVAFCRLGSLKANLGHLDAAAGVAGLIKTVLALQHRQLPPLIHFNKPNPALKLESSPFYASASSAPWEPPAGTPRRAGVSSFGIGGSNAHAVLEEAPAPAARPPTEGPQLLVLSARSEAALAAASQRLAAHLAAHPEQDLADVAYTLQVGRKAFAQRRAWVATSREQAIAALREPQRAGALQARHDGGARPVAFLFSGQGSQHARMGQGLYEGEPAYREAVDRCAALLEPHLNIDIRDVMFSDADPARLNETRLTQPALFVAEYALATCWQAHGVEPAAMLGHSIGEYVAAHLAGVMSLPDALAVVAARGRLMQQQPAGRMAAVHLGAGEVQRWLEPGVEVAAVNAPGLSTVSGPAPAIKALLARLAGASIDARALQTSHAFHSEMMAPALPAFVAVLEGVALAPPQRPFVSNVSGTWITPAQATSPAYWAEHLRRPVLFDAGLRTLAADPTLQFLAAGPGQGRATLARLTLGAGAEAARRVVASMRRPGDARSDAEAFLEAKARLWLAGCGVGWRADAAPSSAGPPPRRRVPLPTYPFERQRHAVEPAPQEAVPARRAGADGLAMPPRSARVDDWFHAPTWSRDDATPQHSSAAGANNAPRWLLLGHCGPLATALAEELKRRGVMVLRGEAGERFEVVEPHCWRMRPSSAADLERLFTAALDTPLTGILHLWGLPQGAGGAGPNAATAALWPLSADEPGYDGLVALALALPDRAAALQPLRLLHVTAGAESVLGEAVRGPTQALATGVVLALPRETPGLQMRAIDLDVGDLAPLAAARAAALLADEVHHPALEPAVAHRAGQRWVRRYERVALPAAGQGTDALLPLRRQGCYLITGGLGGMGLTLGRWLARRFNARLVLTTRRPLPVREAWAGWIASRPADDAQSETLRAISEIEAEGGEVQVALADAADLASMGRAIAAARERFGALHGVFHLAGVAGRGSIARRSSGQDARAVFAPKLGGLQVLCQLLGQEPLDLVVLAGSISAVLPAPGGCDYGAANAVLDAFVQSTARPAAWRHVVAIDWGAWRDVGMAANLSMPGELRARWAEHLEGAIAPSAGIEALARVLASGRRRVVVDTYDVARMHELLCRPTAHAAGVAPAEGLGERTEAVGASTPATTGAGAGAGVNAGASTRPTLSTPYEAPATSVQQRLAEIWEELLGVCGIGIDDDFFELGGHSLMFTRVLALVDGSFGTRLHLRDVFDASTIRLLAERLPSPTRQAAGAGAAKVHGTAEPADAAAQSREVLEL